MARRRAQYVILCEDQQHEAFARRFLKEMKLEGSPRQLRVEKAARGGRSAEHFVRSSYVAELDDNRRRRVDKTLVVLIDGDGCGVQQRLRQLDEVCELKKVQTRSPADKVAVFIPTWNIETWLAYLDGKDADERRSDYPKLP